MMINGLQWISTKAAQCIGNTLITSSTWLIFCGPINDITPATVQNCSSGLVQVWSDPLSSQGLHFLPKTWKCAFWHCSISRSQPAKGARRVASPDVASKQGATPVRAAAASTLGSKVLWHLNTAKYETMLTFILVWPDFKKPWDASTNSVGPGAGCHSTCTSISALTLIWLLFSTLRHEALYSSLL